MYRILLFFVFLFLSNNLVWAQDKFVIPARIEISGNVKTKEYVILRELMFENNRVYSIETWSELLKLSNENLMNTSLFLFVDFQVDSLQGDSISLQIKLAERWYLWPIPHADIDERNFNVWWENRNLDRLSAGIYVRKENFRGRMEVITFLLNLGYNQQFGFLYNAPYVNKSKTIGMGAEVIWTGRNEVISKTINNKSFFIKNYDDFIRTEFNLNANVQYRRNYFTFHFLQLGFKRFQLSDSLIINAPNYSWNQQNNLPFFYLYYKLKIDRRDFRPYPLHGYYADLEVFKNGFKFLTSSNSLDIIDIKTTLRKYYQLDDRIFAAIAFVGKAANYQNQIYLLQKSLGYERDFVRGYEYYVVDGQYYGIVKTNIKYALFPSKILNANFIDAPKFNKIPWSLYLNLFSDFGYATRNKYENITNHLPGSVLKSVGLGLDFVTYYDKVARFEFAINGLNETGFFVHFIAPL